MVKLDVVPFNGHLWKKIAPLWTAMVDQTPACPAFLSGPWISVWLEVYGEILRPDALVWFDGAGHLAAICLLTLRERKVRIFSLRHAFLNATGEGQVASEHNMILARPDHAADVITSLLRHVRARGADALVLEGFREDCYAAVAKKWPDGAKVESFTSRDNFVDLSQLRESKRAFLSTLSRNTREQIKRSMRIYAERLGELRAEVASTPVQVEEFFGLLQSLHAARWQKLGEPGAFAATEAVRFHRRLLAEFSLCVTKEPDFSVELVCIRAGATPIGVLYNLIHRGKIYFYQSGFRYDEDNRLKPGLVSHALAIQRYIEGTGTEYDFLAGERQTVRYKQSLASGVRKLVWSELSTPSVKMQVFGGLRTLKRRVQVASLH